MKTKKKVLLSVVCLGFLSLAAQAWASSAPDVKTAKKEEPQLPQASFTVRRTPKAEFSDVISDIIKKHEKEEGTYKKVN